ncbi:hypothetical protein AA0311_1531 [Asaia bogorensis NBRC 16594]|uniref:Uncharacterized protein n=1 Tax=Asaia bogorensis NBRC 16594 TaxID=1231624 RepID=A0AAN4R4P1_9PROT|nr:hypothetical protein AA0311_1531 [Asaia bogorensis NBRC 16594]GEL54382.1 hypothetical protein ABO01nite_23890 [Asaia bogorensis NBRC 16594]
MSIHAAAALAESHDLAGQYKGKRLAPYENKTRTNCTDFARIGPGDSRPQ